MLEKLENLTGFYVKQVYYTLEYVDFNKEIAITGERGYESVFGFEEILYFVDKNGTPVDIEGCPVL